jgi:hypothetical protein
MSHALSCLACHCTLRQTLSRHAECHTAAASVSAGAFSRASDADTHAQRACRSPIRLPPTRPSAQHICTHALVRAPECARVLAAGRLGNRRAAGRAAHGQRTLFPNAKKNKKTFKYIKFHKYSNIGPFYCRSTHECAHTRRLLRLLLLLLLLSAAGLCGGWSVPCPASIYPVTYRRASTHLA